MVGMSMKSNKPTKTQSKMKKTMRFLSMAALALVGAVTVGCSSDDNIIDTPQQPENKSNVVTLTTTVGLDASRALAVDFTEKKATKTFAAGEKMALVYKNTSNETVKVESDELKAEDIATGGKSATFTFTLTDPDRAQNVTYIYPAAMATDAGAVNYDALATQNGTLATLSSSLDLATYTGAWTGGTSLPAATLDNQLAVLALTLKNSTGSSTITSGLKKVTVSDGTNTYTVTPTSGTFGTDNIYVAIRPVTAALIYTATDGTTNYTKTATSREYAAGGFFNLGLRMAIPSFSISASKKVIFSPGNLQYNASETTYKWRFAEKQYDVIGSANSNISDSYNGWIDLFGWGAWTGSNTVTRNSQTNSEYTWDSADFTQESKLADTNMRSYNWYTLSSAQWVYVFNTRSASTVDGTKNARYAKATVNSVAGVILFPDTYAHPSGVTAPSSINTANAAFTVNSYSAADWTKMQSAGAVFLPAAGYRGGSSVYDVGSRGYYWSSTVDGSDGAYRVTFAWSELSQQDYARRCTGRSVRLVRDVE